jgi:putative transposase
MPIAADIRPTQLFYIHGKGVCRFVEEEGHNVLLFRREGTKLEVRLPEHRFEDMHGKGKLIRLDLDKHGQPVKYEEFGPGEVWTDTEDPAQAKLTPEGRRALALQFYTKKWDDDEKGPLGDKGLQRLIDHFRPTAIGMSFEPGRGENGFRVLVANLRHCIAECGSPGNRPLAAFRSRRGKGTRKRYDDSVEVLLKETVAFYWELRPRDYNDAYAFFRTKIETINAERRTANLPEIEKFPDKPEVIRRRIDKAKCRATWTTKYGRKAAYKKFAGQADHIEARWPLELGIIDATPLDGFVVLDTDTYLPLGKPYLTVCLDVATRMPLGYLITFEPPSLYSALTVLKRVVRSKRYVSQLYPHITRQWDGHGLVAELLLDQAWEHKAPSLQHSLSNIGTDLHWAPAETPQYKAIGERFFRTVTTGLVHKLPGGIPYNPVIMRQVGLDASKDAVITLSDLDALMHEFIVQFIHDKHTGVGGVPARLWRDKLAVNRRRMIADVAALDHILGRVGTATLTNSGITFENMEFHDRTITSDLLDDLVKYASKRSQSALPHTPSRVKVVFTWNPADAGSITVWNHATRQYVSLPNRDPKFFKGISFWHANKIREHCNRLDLDFSSEADRWKGRDDLRKRYEALHRKKGPLREKRDAARSLAFSQGTFDDAAEAEQMPDIGIDSIVDREAEPSAAGMNEPEGVPDELAALLLDAERKPPKGRVHGKKTIAKIKRTKAQTKKDEKDAKHAADVKRQRGDPTGEPNARSTGAPFKLATGPGWGHEPKESTANGTIAPEMARPFNLAKGPGWGSKPGGTT